MSRQTAMIKYRIVRDSYPCYVVAEIGINHNGSIYRIAKKLIDVAVDCGCDAVKFQKRTTELNSALLTSFS